MLLGSKEMQMTIYMANQDRFHEQQADKDPPKSVNQTGSTHNNPTKQAPATTTQPDRLHLSQ